MFRSVVKVGNNFVIAENLKLYWYECLEAEHKEWPLFSVITVIVIPFR